MRQEAHHLTRVLASTARSCLKLLDEALREEVGVTGPPSRHIVAVDVQRIRPRTPSRSLRSQLGAEPPCSVAKTTSWPASESKRQGTATSVVSKPTSGNGTKTLMERSSIGR